MNELIARGTPKTADAPLVNWDDKHCLIIDEIAGIRRLLRESLRNLGVKHCDQATSCGEAIALLSKQRYDIVLCDFNLDGGKNGQQVLEEARLNNWLLPSSMFIIISAEKTAQSVIGAAEQQPDAYLIKPITEGVLLTRLNRIWHEKQLFKHIDQAYADRNFHEAARLCDLQIESDRSHEVELLRMEAQLLIKSGELNAARQVYERILAKNSFSWARVGVAKIRMQEGEFESARQIFQDVINENKFYMDAYDNLATVYQQLGQTDEACNVLEKAAKMSPNSVVRQRTLGEAALKMGKVDLAERAFRKCINDSMHSINKSPEPYLGLARVHGIKQEPKEALALLESVKKEFAGGNLDLRATITKGMVYFESGDTRNARLLGDELEAMLAKTEERPETEICLEMATLLFAVGAQDTPTELLSYVVKNNDDNKAVLESVQQVFEKASMADEGTAVMLASRKQASDLMNQGVLLWKTGKYKEAVDWMHGARSILPDNMRILFNSAQMLISFMQHNGHDPAMEQEAHEVLLHVDKLSPGQYRFVQLMEQLSALSPRNKHAEA
jgi:tetratricopeptide (TPR) repeat protein